MCATDCKREREREKERERGIQSCFNGNPGGTQERGTQKLRRTERERERETERERESETERERGQIKVETGLFYARGGNRGRGG